MQAEMRRQRKKQVCSLVFYLIYLKLYWIELIFIFSFSS